ncbi:MAG: CDF membrane [Trebouxia sp. A1-2]|nr:MAG: CDF membrane [Trebouxia sp. A1-2]
MTSNMAKELTDSASPPGPGAAALPVATCTPDLAVRPEPPVSVQEARLALARTSAAAQAAARPPAHSDAIEKRAKVAMNLSCAADSFVDIASQAVLAFAQWRMKKLDHKFPVGRTRLETVAVIVCAVIMSIATVLVIRESIGALIDGLAHHNRPALDASAVTFAILGGAVALKIGLYFVCVSMRSHSATMLALAEDHLNDIMSNLVAIFGVAIASQVPKVWYLDPAGAIAISLYIIYSWIRISKGQVDKILGKTAPPAFIGQLRELALKHHDLISVDVIRAYHFGQRYLVELEIMLPEDMSVKESHDIALMLQHKVEGLEEVERAFVHVDYALRAEPEHKVERNLASGAKNLFMPHMLVAEQVPLVAADYLIRSNSTISAGASSP